MGNALSSLFSGGKSGQDIFIDFENARPSEDEREMYEENKVILDKMEEHLEALRNYTGAKDLIRDAINSPSKETEDAVWEALKPRVRLLREFQLFADELKTMVPAMLAALATAEKEGKTFESQQALCTQVAHTYAFLLTFDDLKITNPHLQNDFSYYRRSLARAKAQDLEIVVGDEAAANLSLFYAVSNPMLRAVSSGTAEYVSQSGSRSDIFHALGRMANVCCSMVENKKFANEDTNAFCMRVMTAALVSWDHAETSHTSLSDGPIKVKNIIKTLKKHENTDNLLNAIRYTTRTASSPDTPSSVQNLLA